MEIDWPNIFKFIALCLGKLKRALNMAYSPFENSKLICSSYYCSTSISFLTKVLDDNVNYKIYWTGDPVVHTNGHIDAETELECAIYCNNVTYQS